METLPGLQWPTLPRHHVDRNRGLRDIDAQLEQLTVDLGSAPERVLNTHSSDQIAHLFADPWSATARTGFPSPVRGEIETHDVHDALDSRHGSDNGAIIIDVGMDRLDTEPTVREKGCGAFWMPRCDPHRKIALKQTLDDAPTEKASPAEYGDFPSCHRSIPRPMPSCRYRHKRTRGGRTNESAPKAGGLPKFNRPVPQAATLVGLTSRSLLELAIGIDRGFIASGILRTR
jgi:hypothetical protein